MRVVLSLLVVLFLFATAYADCSGSTCRAPVRKSAKATVCAPAKPIKAKPLRRVLSSPLRLCRKGTCK